TPQDLGSTLCTPSITRSDPASATSSPNSPDPRSRPAQRTCRAWTSPFSPIAPAGPGRGYSVISIIGPCRSSCAPRPHDDAPRPRHHRPRAAPDGRVRACRRSRSVPLPCPSPPLLVAQPVATVVVTGDLDGLTALLVQLTTSLTRPGHEPLLACLALCLALLAHGGLRDRLQPRGPEARRQPQVPLLGVHGVGPDREDRGALRLGAVVAGGSLKVAERALGVGPVAMIAALSAPQAEHLPAPGILCPCTQLDVEHLR